MKKYLILAVTVFFSALFAGQIGPWSHFKAITSDFTVNLEDTLLITPGTEIRFAPNIKFNIFGVVFANGTSTAPITFSALSPTNPTWGGIFISNSTPGKVSVFNYSSFSKINTSGDGAMYIGNSNVNFNFCNFANNHSDLKGGAIYAMAGSLNFNSCQFKDNSADMGGAVYIHNYSTVSPSVIYIQNCRFLSNTAMNGGGLYIEDYDGAMFNMILIVVNSGFFFNKANGCGGGLFLNCLSHIDFTLKKTKIQYNESMTSGGGIYAVYNDLYSQDVLGQEYSNLLITQNISEIEGAGVWFNSGMTTNSSAFTFINTTITYNKIRQEIIPKTVGGAGIYIYSEGNYPVIRNSIIWGNNEDQFMINDPGGPDPDAVFHYCNVQGAFTGIDGLDSIPRFVRPPLLAGDWSSTPERYNYHLLISSPSIDAGDPETPCTERNSTRVNQGAYGNTAEARLSLDGADVLPIDTGTNINVGDYGVTVLDFQNAATSFNFSKISMGSGAELHLKNLSNFAIIGIDTLLTNGIAKFDDERVVIQPDYSSDVSVPQELKVTNLIDLYGADISNIKLNIYSTGKSNPEVNINNTTMYSSSYRDEYGISITDASTVNIENCSIDNFAGG
ncbi:MAG: hypothetical protein KKD38_03735, partial [Candidatus Delongbacteria bacterium]|nr:hypothetical protein [Candidatus Delongbacteria bacterium]